MFYLVYSNNMYRELKSKDTCIFFPSCHVDVGNQAKHPYNIRAGDNEAFLSAVEKVTRNRMFDSRCGMGALAYRIHDWISLIIPNCHEYILGRNLLLGGQIVSDCKMHKSRSQKG